MTHFRFTPLFSALVALAATTYAPRSYAIRGDYTGDGKADLVVATISTSPKRTTFQVYDVDGQATSSAVIDAQADAIVPGDYDGDGVTDHTAVYVLPDGTLQWNTLIDGQLQTSIFGANGDKPLSGDVDCDGTSDKIVIRKISDRLRWYFKLSSGQNIEPITYGRTADQVFTARMASTGCDHLVLGKVKATSIVYVNRSLRNSRYTETSWGSHTDSMLPPADIDGDGIDDLIVTRTSGTAVTALVKPSAGGATLTKDVGTIDDIPLTGNFAGAATSEFGYYHPATSGQFTLKLSGGDTVVTMGTKTTSIVRPDNSVAVPVIRAPGACATAVSIDSIIHVLYKPSNLHGGRGPTFLVQNVAERTLKRRLNIYDAKCRRISAFGLYRTDHPYGSRYYQRSGGSGHSAAQLLRLAKKAGSTAIYVEGKGRMIKVDNPEFRQGTIDK